MTVMSPISRWLARCSGLFMLRGIVDEGAGGDAETEEKQARLLNSPLRTKVTGVNEYLSERHPQADY